MESVIEVSDLVARYGKHRDDVLHRLSFRVRRGEVFGFLGHNGAGKSTTIKAILGLLIPTSGKVTLHDLPASNPRARLKIGFMPEEATYYRYLTPVEILDFYGELFGIPKAERRRRAKALLELVGLSVEARRPLSTFSKGMVQKLSLAQALINNPDTLILDEPTTGLDPLAKKQMREILSDLRSQGKTVFFSSHELSEVETLCDTVLIIKKGRVLRSGPLKDILKEQGGRSLEQYFLQTMEAAR